MATLGETLFGGPRHLPEAELSAVHRILARINNALGTSGGRFTIFSTIARGACVVASEERALCISAILPDHRWRVTSYTFCGRSASGGLHTFNVVAYRASDGIEYLWTVDDYLGPPAIDYHGTSYPVLTYQTPGNKTYFGDGRTVTTAK